LTDPVPLLRVAVVFLVLVLVLVLVIFIFAVVFVFLFFIRLFTDEDKRTSVGGRSRVSDSLAFHLPHRRRGSPLWFSRTSVQIKLAEQVPVRSQRVTRKGGRGKELALAFGAACHCRHLALVP
jgi:hypothetical protein